MVLQLSGYHLGRFVPGVHRPMHRRNEPCALVVWLATKCRGLLGGGGHRSRYCNRSRGAEKNLDMTHLQWNRVRVSFHGWARDTRSPSPRHRDDPERRRATPGEIARHGVDETGASTTVPVGQESIDHRHRGVGTTGAQLRASPSCCCARGWASRGGSRWAAPARCDEAVTGTL
jgi:hypothetical protein